MNSNARVLVTVILAISLAATGTVMNSLPNLYLLATSSARTARNAIADACAVELARAAEEGPAAMAATSATLIRKYELRSV
ncbi:MAG: hypothetical protein ABI837_21895, partial [Acidobacteriota bacterium]